MLDLVQASCFFWPKKAAAVGRRIQTCNCCARSKSPPDRAALLANILTSCPLELVSKDFLSLEPDCSNIKDILVITDHFTKYGVALPTPNQKACPVAKTLWGSFIVHCDFLEAFTVTRGQILNPKPSRNSVNITEKKICGTF